MFLILHLYWELPPTLARYRVGCRITRLYLPRIGQWLGGNKADRTGRDRVSGRRSQEVQGLGVRGSIMNTLNLLVHEIGS